MDEIDKTIKNLDDQINEQTQIATDALKKVEELKKQKRTLQVVFDTLVTSY
jgi:archaellum component FlaC